MRKDCICGHTYDEHYVRDSDGARVCLVSTGKTTLCRCLRYRAPKRLLRPVLVVLMVLGIAPSTAQANTLTCHHARVLIERHYHLRWYQVARVATAHCSRSGRHYVRIGRYRVRYDPDSWFPYQRIHFRR